MLHLATFAEGEETWCVSFVFDIVWVSAPLPVRLRLQNGHSRNEVDQDELEYRTDQREKLEVSKDGYGEDCRSDPDDHLSKVVGVPRKSPQSHVYELTLVLRVFVEESFLPIRDHLDNETHHPDHDPHDLSGS
jgi:hypothetical protein